MMLMALKIAPALVAGNSVVVKSAEEAPFCVLRACQILNQVLPPGVLNILSGNGPDCGGPLSGQNAQRDPVGQNACKAHKPQSTQTKPKTELSAAWPGRRSESSPRLPIYLAGTV